MVCGAHNEPRPLFVYRFHHRGKSSQVLRVVFSGWGTGRRGPVSQDIAVNIAPALRATVIDTLGRRQTIPADLAGNVTMTSTGSPVRVTTAE